MCQACANGGAPAPFSFAQAIPPPPYRPMPDYMCYPYGNGMNNGMTLMIPPPPIPAPKPAEPEKKAEPKKEEKKKDNKKDNKKKSSADDKPGSKLLLPKKMCYMHTVKDTLLWKVDKATDFKFVINRVPLSLTVGDVIEAVSGKEGEEIKAWCLTEVIEVGDGKWSKGRVVAYEDAGKITLESFGCSAKQGESLPPNWVVVHKKE